MTFSIMRTAIAAAALLSARTHVQKCAALRLKRAEPSLSDDPDFREVGRDSRAYTDFVIKYYKRVLHEEPGHVILGDQICEEWEVRDKTPPPVAVKLLAKLRRSPADLEMLRELDAEVKRKEAEEEAMKNHIHEVQRSNAALHGSAHYANHAVPTSGKRSPRGETTPAGENKPVPENIQPEEEQPEEQQKKRTLKEKVTACLRAVRGKKSASPKVGIAPEPEEEEKHTNPIFRKSSPAESQKQ